MAELSFPWPETSGPIVGDGREFTSAEWDQYWEMFLSQMGGATEGVLPEVWNELEVTDPDVVNKVDVNTGAACVKGKAYWNTVSNRLTVASAGAGATRKDRVILRCDWTGGVGTQYTTRLAVKQGTQADPPALTQTDNTVWEISLAQFVVDDAGGITGMTDERAYCHFATKVDEDMLDVGAVTEAKIATGAVTNNKLGADAVTGAKIADNAVDSEHYTDGSIDRVHLGADIIDSTKLEDNAVNSEHYVDASIDTAHLGDLQVTAAKLAANAVETAKIKNANVTAAKLATNAVETAKIKDANVTAAKLSFDVATQAELDTHAAITAAHGAVVAATANKIILRDASGRAKVADPSADADIANKGWVNANLPGGNVPVGCIVLWSGAVVDIPANWQLCDGTNGTPNLRNRFVYGAGSGGGYQNPDASGGATWKNLAHTHNFSDESGSPSATASVAGGSGALPGSGTHYHSVSGDTGSGGSATQDIMPPWYALCYIQRIT